MKLTKKLNEEILKVYNTYWESYSTGDVKTFAGTLDKTFEMIGTSETEICHTKEEGIKFLKAQVKELVGKVEMRNRKIRVAPVNELALVNEQCDIYILSGKAWSFYSKIRISTFLRNTYTGWKVFQQHGSLPDMQVQEGETLAFKKISKENLQLREAVKRRTVEIVHKNRELEIEASLERVRTVAMSMKKPEDMLRVCKTISQQLQKLGVKEIRNVQTAIFYEAKGTYMNYEFYAKHNKTFITDTLYTNHRIAKAFAAKMMKGKGQFYVTHLKGQKVKDWIAYQKTTNVFIDKFLNTATSLNYYWHSLGPVALGISTYVPLTQDEKKLFSRFLKVFDLAYRRYLDIEKAAAQAKEAEIELALERVRARTMAMQKSDELSETSFLLFQQLKELGETAAQISIGIVKEEEGFVELSATFHGDPLLKTYHVSIEEPFMMKKAVKAWKEKKKTSVVEINGKELIKYNNWRNRFLKKKIVFSESRWLVHFAFFSKGMLSFSSEKELSKESFQLLERFSGVFEQTYTRFLDLQKAEAQTKEAQIEGALEKVRSSSLAMHRSDEMQAVVNTVIDQLQKLNIVLDTTNILIFNNQEKFIEFWTGSNSTGAQLTTSWRVPYFNISYYKAIHQAHENGKEIFTGKYSFKEKNKLFKHLFANTDFKNLNAERKKFILKSPRVTIVAAIAKDTAIQVVSYTRESFSEDEIEILKRFSKVFNQAYTRFLDLQKAEAQAREAQIETSLERVRSRSMAMHASKELKEVAKEMRNQFSLLGLKELETCAIHLWDQSSHHLEAWAALRNPDNTGEIIESEISLSIKGIRILEESFQKYLAGKKDYVVISDADRAKEFFEAIKKVDTKTYAFLSNRTKNIKPKDISAYWAVSDFHGGSLVMVTVNAPDENSRALLRRFANVFGQAYQRFKDLQKAEAQARESQIQLALERVRARTMAMQKSDELSEAVFILFNQFKELGERPDQATIGIINEKEWVIEYWVTMYGNQMAKVFKFSFDEPHVTNRIYKAWKEEKKSLVIDLSGKELNEFTHYRERMGGAKHNPDEKRRIFNIAFFSKGLLIVQSNETRTEESIGLLERFAAVFEQTYTRFLDLQKAETQAREAKIETALEKVRSRSLAMHKSDELNEVVTVLFERLKDLQIPVTAVGIHIFIEGTKDLNVYVCGDIGNGLTINNYRLPYFNHPIANDLYDVQDKGADFFVGNYSRQQKNSFYKHVFKNSALNAMPDDIKNMILQSSSYSITLVPAKNSVISVNDFEGKPLTANETDVLIRFAKVFDQAYIRFLDLQKAEAQTREGQIQLALERVRARTMAMQKSDELPVAANLLFQQVQSLGMPAWSAGYCTWNDDKKSSISLSMSSEGVLQPTLSMPLTDDPSLIHFREAWERGESYFVEEVGGEELKKHYVYLRTLPGVKETLDDIEAAGFPLPAFQIFHLAYFSKGFLLFITYEPVPDAHDIFKRFALVFEQTYTRFLDLQKAEAQSRESQIQLALERVRAKTMAMQRSEELGDVATELFKQMTRLVDNLWTCGFVLCENDRKEDEWWLSTETGFIPAFSLPNFGDRIHENLYNGWKNGESFRAEQAEGAELEQHYEWLMNMPVSKKIFDDMAAAGYQKPIWQKLHAAYFSKGYLVIITQVPSEGEEVFKRFAQVFDLTYTRFLDLQKAEAQAREAKIEAALEKVRSRTMAMHISTELKEVARELRMQLASLGTSDLETCAINLYEEDENYLEAWAAVRPPDSPDEIIEFHFNLPKKGIYIIEDIIAAYTSGTEEFLFELAGEKGVQWMKSMSDLVPDMFAAAAATPEFKETGAVQAWFSCHYFSGGALIMITMTPPLEESLLLLKRCTQVFGLAYRRFADLKNAEAQAREAQIEAGLERVRSRTMAMHKSDELTDAAALLFRQIEGLGIKSWTTGFNVWSDDNNFYTDYVTSSQGAALEPYTIDSSAYEVFRKVSEAKKRGDDFYINYEEGEALKETYRQLSNFNNKSQFDKMLEDGFQFPAQQYEHFVFGAKVSLMFITYEPVPEAHDIFKRFGKVFEQTYTRFLDLQKAEAQAREAEIELGLERVRSRAMAMQSSDEVNELIGTVFTELTKLDLLLTRCIIWVFEPATLAARWWMANIEEPSNPMNFYIKYHEHPAYLVFVEAWKRQNVKFVYDLKGQDKKNWDDILFNETELKNLPGVVKNGMQEPERVLLSASFNNFGGINVASLEPLSEEHFNILLRFAKVFDLTYTRFLDLQKAEKQAKEARIEASLERVRSRTMAMHSSDDVGAATATMFTELEKLGVQNLRGGIAIINPDQTQEVWSITHLPDGTVLRAIGVFDMRLHPFWQQIFEAHKRKEDFDYYWLAGKDKEDYIAIINATPGYLAQPIKEFPDVHIQSYYFGEGAIWTNSMQPHSEEQRMVMKKFASVFSLTFRRYQDLQKAEAQSRESQIQLALERVRASTAAMHKSEELIEVIGTVFQQLQQLHFTIDAASLSLDYKEDPFIYWMAVSGYPYPSRIHVPYKPIPFMDRLIAHAGKGQSFFTELFNREEKNEWVDHILEHTIVKQVPDERKKMMYGAPGLAVSVAVSNNIALTIANYAMKPFKEDENEIVRRFSKVFEQTYTRFLDLQKAEAQAREGQVQLALERVRARTMAMQKSEELSDTSFVLFQQLKELGEVNVQTTIAIFDEDQPVITLYATTHGNQWRQGARIELNKHSIYQQMYSVWKQNLKSLVIDISGKELESLNKFKLAHPDYQVSAEDLPKDRWLIYCAYFSKGSLSIATTIPRPDESIKLLERFAQVFDLTYTRFLDLKKAEEQAREAQIEVALERVRGKAMAMHSPKDLADTIGIFYQQIKMLSVTPRRCGVCLMYKETNTCDLYNMNTTEQGDSFEAVGKLKLAGHPVLKGVYDHWLSQQDYHPVLRGDELKEYYKNVRTQMTSYPEYLHDEVQYGYFFSFPEGNIYAWTINELSENDLQIYRRFTSVLSLTYKRYKDLQTAETNAKEAVKQAALDRIRADIASMRSISDLDRITPLIWNELTTLNIPFIRCGVFIMDETQQLIHTFLSNPEGKAIAAFHLPYDTPGNLSKVLSHWKEHKNYIDHWEQTSFTDLADILVKQGAIAAPGQYLDAIPQGGFYLHFLPFIQGMLYVGNTTLLNDDDINLLQAVADAFATAYARYEDFNKLEVAKKQVDSTLTELQSTQKQLIQSEKMASLGELTAGIAHEIQNPLNFVNNFSEVSNELIHEMLEEVEKGNYEEVKAIADDVKQNLEKINHHGKRADGIVKGMLQHSRTNTGQKELTDINALCDEYLRLAYHGLRAKDKSFNAKFETDLDSSVGTINIMAQDIGRVILNLINNAFYTVSEKKKLGISGYEPTVTVSTRKSAEVVLVSVKDNGNGIPRKVLDKIFQPFFTTKPTGQGTGLELSLSYDIVKAHGGEIKVETKEGEGTEFVIVLPV